MGFFDTVKDKAGALAADTQRAGKVTAAQARLVVLQNDLKKAERELGHATFALAERGEFSHPDLEHALARLRATMAEVHGKEAEIAALRGEAAPVEAPMTTAPAPATPVAPAVGEEAAAEASAAAARGGRGGGGSGRRGGGREAGKEAGGPQDRGRVRGGEEARSQEDAGEEAGGHEASCQGEAEEVGPESRRDAQEVDAALFAGTAPRRQEPSRRLLRSSGGGRRPM